jgi:peptidyl-dipeptidase A
MIGVMFLQRFTFAILVAGILAAGLGARGQPVSGPGRAAARTPTVVDARKFLDEVDQSMRRLGIDLNRTGWVQGTHITHDTDILAAQASQAFSTAVTKYAMEAARFDRVDLPPDLRRQMNLLKLSLTLAAPADPGEAAEATRLVASMESAYGRGKYCPGGGQECLDINAVEQIMRESRDTRRLRDVWEGWHAVGVPMKNDFARFAELSNKGARQLGFADTGAMWRSKYDMPPDTFARELDRLWEQLRPLYVSLHAYVRWKLREKYGDMVPATGPMPAHVLGNLWAQNWSHVYDLVAPANADPGYSLTEILTARKIDPLEMVRYGERFFTSLGFDPLPKTFWERSLFVKPRDREVVCHASAWDIDLIDDVRIKMCIEITEEDFTTIHHELGHNFYQRAYSKLPVVLRDSANDGFHEALGDVLALSVTPEYLAKIGLLESVPDPSKDIGLLLRRALERLAFLPFGLVVDGWRWQVFAGTVGPAEYNRAWWDLKHKYQGVAPPAPRGESFFDPGAKYHVPANTPYARYFLAHVLEFQFHRALSNVAGCRGPLHRCSIYDSKEAGRRLKTMMELGQSRPWPEALAIVTGRREMDAAAMAEYFEPLKRWLDEQNRGKPVGW